MVSDSNLYSNVSNLDIADAVSQKNADEIIHQESGLWNVRANNEFKSILRVIEGIHENYGANIIWEIYAIGENWGLINRQLSNY